MTEKKTDELDPIEALAMLGEAAVAAGKGARVYLYRLAPRAKYVTEDAYLARFDTAPELEEIRESFGGGTFRIRLLVAGKWTGTVADFSIEGRPKFIEGEEPVVAIAPAKAQREVDPEVAELLKMIRMQNIAKILSGKNGGEGDSLKMVKDLLDLVDRRAGVAGDDDEEEAGDPMMTMLGNVLELLKPKPGAPAGVAVLPRKLLAAPPVPAAPNPTPHPPAPVPNRFDHLGKLLRARASADQVAAVAVRILAPFEAEHLLAAPAADVVTMLAARGGAIPGENPEAYVEEIRAAMVAAYNAAAGVSEPEGDENGGGAEG